MVCWNGKRKSVVKASRRGGAGCCFGNRSAWFSWHGTAEGERPVAGALFCPHRGAVEETVFFIALLFEVSYKYAFDRICMENRPLIWRQSGWRQGKIAWCQHHQPQAGVYFLHGYNQRRICDKLSIKRPEKKTVEEKVIAVSIYVAFFRGICC